MSVSSDGDPEGGEGRAGSRAWWRRAAARLTGPARLSAGHTQIAPTLRWVNRNPARALAFLGLP
jgi:hypothetical protein